MESQRRIIADLMSKYLLNDEESYNRARGIEDLSLVDELSDAIWQIHSGEKPFGVAVQGVRELLETIGNRLTSLEQLEWPPRRTEQ